LLSSWQAAAALPLAGNQNHRTSRLSLPADPGCPLPLPKKKNQSRHHLNQRRPSPHFPLTFAKQTREHKTPPGSLPHSHFQHRLHLLSPLQQPKQLTSFFSFAPERPPPSLEKENLEKPLLWGFLIFSFFSLQPDKSSSPSATGQQSTHWPPSPGRHHRHPAKTGPLHTTELLVFCLPQQSQPRSSCSPTHDSGHGRLADEPLNRSLSQQRRSVPWVDPPESHLRVCRRATSHQPLWLFLRSSTI
jgi:hypothetical protein